EIMNLGAERYGNWIDEYTKCSKNRLQEKTTA
ncbi:hypothetical protein Tco_1307311, partial [Tanacetum coccineum]